jgi:hypothetical protein
MPCQYRKYRPGFLCLTRLFVATATLMATATAGPAPVIANARQSSMTKPSRPRSTHPSTPPVRSIGSALRVSQNGRYLIRADGTPFFWLGDTAWLLFQMADREDAALYLQTRARQGFTVIQAAVVMGEGRVGGTLRPNRSGDLAFIDGDPARPAVISGSRPADAAAYDYWDHVDSVIDMATSHGLTLALLPLFVGSGGDGYKYLTPDNAGAYGRFLGQRYRTRTHLIWLLGGDNTPDTDMKRKVWDEMAKGIAIGVAGSEEYGKTLMSYHINGNNSSSQWLHTAPWLDFNMAQLWGHEQGIFPTLLRDYQLSPAKPTGLGEGSYEDGPQYSTKPIDALKVRQQAYWSYLAGGYHTYGNTNTWNFSTYKPEGTQNWKAALDSPGARHLSVLARFFASLEWWQLDPDSSVLASGAGSGEKLNAAMRSEKGDRILAYLSSPTTVSIRMDRLTAGNSAATSWIDPTTGARTAIGDLPTQGEKSFTTPDGWQDALLLLEARRSASAR